MNNILDRLPAQLVAKKKYKMKKCEKHPKYKGKRIPSNQCEDCANFYLTLQTPRAPILPTKVVPDKKRKYDRQKEKRVTEEKEKEYD